MKMVSGKTDAGFTLLELLLVIVIMAVTSMMVAPSYFSTVSVSIDDEGKRLAQVLRLASEEATLAGNTFRVRFRQHSYQLQSADQEGAWQTLLDRPYQPYQLPEGFQVVEIKPTVPLTEGVDGETKNTEPVLADILLLPEGISQIADIVLAAEPANGRQLIVRLRPGPGGIHVEKASDGQ